MTAARWALSLLLIAASEGAGQQSNVPVLDNGRLRIETAPDVFAVRFVGAPGGQNLLASAFVPSDAREGAAWCYPGGLFTTVLPFRGAAPALRRGPATVLSHDGGSVTLLGRPDTRTTLQLKKTLLLKKRSREAEFRIAVLSGDTDAAVCRVQSAAALPAGAVVQDPAGESELHVTESPPGFTWPSTTAGPEWRIETPLLPRPGSRVRLEAQTRVVSVRVGEWRWTRRLPTGAQGAFAFIYDPETASHWAVFEGPEWEVSASNPETFVEQWRLEQVEPHE